MGEKSPTLETVELNGKQFAVVLPTDFATQRELISAVELNTMRGCCAVVGYCLPGLGLQMLYQAVGYDALVYGAEVWERLVKQGVDETDIPSIGVEIYKVMRPDTYPTEDEIKAAMVFSSPPEETSKENASPSSATGGNNQAGLEA